MESEQLHQLSWIKQLENNPTKREGRTFLFCLYHPVPLGHILGTKGDSLAGKSSPHRGRKSGRSDQLPYSLASGVLLEGPTSVTPARDQWSWEVTCKDGCKCSSVRSTEEESTVPSDLSCRWEQQLLLPKKQGASTVTTDFTGLSPPCIPVCWHQPPESLPTSLAPPTPAKAGGPSVAVWVADSSLEPPSCSACSLG